MKHEGLVSKLRSSEALCIHHQLKRFRAIGGSDTRIGGRGRPYFEASRNHSGGNGEQTGLAHVNSPYEFSLARATIRSFRIVPMSLPAVLVSSVSPKPAPSTLARWRCGIADPKPFRSGRHFLAWIGFLRQPVLSLLGVTGISLARLDRGAPTVTGLVASVRSLRPQGRNTCPTDRRRQNMALGLRDFFGRRPL
jgi:hypothetical protein